jgi:hypothetical protein
MLGVDPGMEVVTAVEDAAAETEAARAGAKVPPVAQGGDGVRSSSAASVMVSSSSWWSAGWSGIAASWRVRVSLAGHWQKALFRAVC